MGNKDAAYFTALPRFTPSSMSKLPSGNYLITNSYTASNPLFTTRQFLGEVFEVKGSDKRFGDFSVPKIANGVPPAVPFNRQQMGSSDNTSLLEQPLFASRLFQ